MARCRASSLDQVISESFSINHVAKCTVVWDGDKYRYSLKYDVTLSDQEPGSQISTAPFGPQETLKDKGLMLSFDSFGGMGTLEESDIATRLKEFTPHSMMEVFSKRGPHTVSSLILEGLDSPENSRLSRSIWLDGKQIWNGQEYWVFSVSDKKDTDIPVHTFYVDPTRGFLPGRRVVSPPSLEVPYWQTLVAEWKPLPNDRWFPIRTVSMPVNPDGEKPFNLIQVKVTELNLTDRPKESDFQVAVNQTTYIRDPKKDGSQIAVEPAAYTLKDLPLLAKRMESAYDRSSLRLQGERVPPSGGKPWRLAVIAINVTLIAIIAFVLWRRRVATSKKQNEL